VPYGLLEYRKCWVPKGARALFPEVQKHRLQVSNFPLFQRLRNGEFLVAVFSGSVNTKMYKIKRKHQSKLGSGMR
jgi:hypothetical protein